MPIIYHQHSIWYIAVANLLLSSVVQSLSSFKPSNIIVPHNDDSRPKECDDHDAYTKVANRLVIFGLGNIGSLVATATTSQSSETVPFFKHVCGTSRSNLKDIPGVHVIHFEDYQELAKNLQTCTHILVTIPPVKPSSTDLDCNVDDIIVIGGRRRRWNYFCDPVLNHPKFSLNELVPSNAWLGYISSTSVYGNHDGEWVTEESEVKFEPGSKGELYFTAENEWRDAAREFGWRLHVFRAAGLYGNTRSALHTLRKGNFDDESGSKQVSFTSRIHEEDVTRAIVAAMQYNQPLAGESCLWNLADDCPAPRAEVMMFGKELLEESNLLPPTSLASKATVTNSQQIATERARRRSTDKKRVLNQRMKNLLLPDGQLTHPTYREGLSSILGFNRKKWSS